MLETSTNYYHFSLFFFLFPALAAKNSFPKSFIGSPAPLYMVCHLPELSALSAHSLGSRRNSSKAKIVLFCKT